MTTKEKPPTLSVLDDLPKITTKAEFDIAEKRIEHAIELERATQGELEKESRSGIVHSRR